MDDRVDDKVDDKDGRQLSDWRRKRVERFKVYIRIARFLKRIYLIPLCIAYGLCVSMGILSLIRYGHLREEQKLQRQREQLAAVRMAEAAETMADSQPLYEKNEDLFGQLLLYETESYGREHSVIHFNSLRGQQQYELVAVFFLQVYYREEDEFLYCQFFQPDTPEEFGSWYRNIKELSLYDTGTEAGFEDEFITLSCGSGKTENEQIVVVGKRVD